MRTEAQRLARGHTTGEPWNTDSNLGPLSPELTLCFLPSRGSKFLSCDLRQHRGRNQTGSSSSEKGLESFALTEPSSVISSHPALRCWLEGVTSVPRVAAQETAAVDTITMIQGLGSHGSRPAPEAFVALTKGDLKLWLFVGPMGQGPDAVASGKLGLL